MGTSFTIFSVELQWLGNRAAFSLKEFPCTGWYLPLSFCKEKDILCRTKYLVSTQRQIGPEFELLPQQEKILPSQTYRYKGDTVPCTLGTCVPLILPALPGWWYTSGFCCQWAAGQVEKKHAQLSWIHQAEYFLCPLPTLATNPAHGSKQDALSHRWKYLS